MKNRRNFLKSLSILPLAAYSSQTASAQSNASDQRSRAEKVVIRKVRAITTAPYGTGLVVVKVETDQPGLHGVGCATFTQRISPVVAAVNDFLDPFCRG